MTTSTDAERVRAKGRDITLADGRTVTIRFDFATLCAAEEEFGSIAQMAIQTGGGYHGSVHKGVRRLVALVSGIAEEELNELLDPHAMDAYTLAIDEALDEALPRTGDGEGKALANGSPGSGSTTSAPSDSDEAKPTSGG